VFKKCPANVRGFFIYKKLYLCKKYVMTVILQLNRNNNQWNRIRLSEHHADLLLRKNHFHKNNGIYLTEEEFNRTFAPVETPKQKVEPEIVIEAEIKPQVEEIDTIDRYVPEKPKRTRTRKPKQ
jgi:hypothetical protein